MNASGLNTNSAVWYFLYYLGKITPRTLYKGCVNSIFECFSFLNVHSCWICTISRHNCIARKKYFICTANIGMYLDSAWAYGITKYGNVFFPKIDTQRAAFYFFIDISFEMIQKNCWKFMMRIWKIGLYFL